MSKLTRIKLQTHYKFKSELSRNPTNNKLIRNKWYSTNVARNANSSNSSVSTLTINLFVSRHLSKVL